MDFNNKKRWFLTTIIILLSLKVSSSWAIKLRVGIKQGIQRVCISSEGFFDILNGKEIVETVDSGEVVTIHASNKGLYIEGLDKYFDKLVFFPLTSFIYVDKIPYRGEIEVINRKEGLVVINIVDLEEYLYGVVGCEVSEDWDIEVLRAQAVIARTFALRCLNLKRHQDFWLCDTVHCQVYQGINAESWKVKEAVDSTKGLVLTYKGELALTPYHAFCGGQTLSSYEAWGKDIPYLISKNCFGYKICPKNRYWKAQISTTSFINNLNKLGYNLNKIRFIRQLNNKIIILHDNNHNLTLTTSKFRQIIGNNIIKSLQFKVKYNYDLIIVEGIGCGHGVGLCQWGAKYLSTLGYDYKKILQYYYPYTELTRISY